MSYSENQPILSTTESIEMYCSTCNKTVHSIVEYKCGIFAYVLALVLFCIGCVFCFWIPLVFDFSKDIHYKCPLCNTVLAIKTKV
ncbi:hypothetical protein ENUP19_0340G0009 [Entamoeba nuttalli]|uniref:LITAF domain-containing protein n=1 Tax=Entamoeba nuttalli TaxID=412467 RepID=A0ABQ0DX31_9EUKA